MLRVGVRTSGRAGMSHEMSWTDAAGPGDELIEARGARVLVDRRAALFLAGTVMDWKDGSLASGFRFSSPNERGRCGCGESFAV